MQNNIEGNIASCLTRAPTYSMTFKKYIATVYKHSIETAGLTLVLPPIQDVAIT